MVLHDGATSHIAQTMVQEAFHVRLISGFGDFSSPQVRWI